jgi:hypothetical protein
VALKIIMLIKNWRKMLTNSIEPVDLLAERLKLEKLVPSEVQEYFFLIKMICMKCITQLCIIQQSEKFKS